MSGMLPSLTHNEILRLAPDEKSLASARSLLNVRYWSHLGVSPEVLWGVCQGSAKYLVKIELASLTMSCPCPSRKRPCRHTLGMLLLFSQTPDLFEITTPPEEVEEWLSKRRRQAEKKSQTEIAPEKPIDEVAQQKRVDLREKRVLEAIESLRSWMKDLIFAGLATVENQPDEYFERQARRLVDLQATGLANRIRSLAEIPGTGPDWPQRFLNSLGMLELLLSAYENLDQLPPALQSDVRQLLGWTVRQTDLQELGKRETGTFRVLSVETTDEDRLKSQRIWLQNQETGDYRLVLQFAPGRQNFEYFWRCGSRVVGECLVYPGEIPERVRFQAMTVLDESSPHPNHTPPLYHTTTPSALAVPKTQPEDGSETQRGVADSVGSLLQDFAEKLARNPFLSHLPVALSPASLVYDQKNWYLRDQTGDAIKIRSSEPWNLLALTGGEMAHWFGEWNGESFLPLAIIEKNEVHEV